MNRIATAGFAGLALMLTLAACSKSSTTTTTTSTDTSAPADQPSSGSMAMSGPSANDGGKLYQTNCSSCHQATGMGIEGTFPPLAKNPVVVGDATKVIHILKYGLNGKIEVNGHSYNGMMPAWAQQLSDADIASTITFIRSAWGNKASPVTEAQVKAVTK